MRAAALFREVTRNLASGTSRVGLFSIVSVTLLGSVLAADLLSISQRITDGLAYRESGSAVSVLSLPGRISGEACEALSEVPDIVASGAMRGTGKVAAMTLPGEPLDSYTVTPSFAKVLGASDRGSGVYVSADAARALGSGSLSVTSPSQSVRGEYSYPSDGRRAGFGWAVLSPTSDYGPPFDECWVLAWPQRSDVRQLLLMTTSAGGPTGRGDQPVVTQLNTKYGASFGGVVDYESRVTQYAAHALVLLGCVLGALSVWMRRVEIASNLHAGGQRRPMRVQFVMETAAWALPASALCWSLGLVLSIGAGPTEITSLSLRTTQIVVAFFLSSLTGAVIGLQCVREERLVRYVKGR